MKTMKILLIHTNGTSIAVDMLYKTLDDARAALKKAYDETKPCTFDAECENMSYCGENVEASLIKNIKRICRRRRRMCKRVRKNYWKT